MTANKTQATDASVVDFLNLIDYEQKRNDSFRLVEIMENVSGSKAKMWGGYIIGFGDYHYKTAAGREGDWFKIGFSPRKQALTVYATMYFKGVEEEMKVLGKYKTGKSCIYIKKLEDIDIDILTEILKKSCKNLSATE